MKDIKLMIEEYKSCLYFNEDRYLDALQGDPISICDIGTDFAREQNYENAVQCWLYNVGPIPERRLPDAYLHEWLLRSGRPLPVSIPEDHARRTVGRRTTVMDI